MINLCRSDFFFKIFAIVVCTLFISGQSRNSIQSGKNHQNNKSGPHPARKFDWMLNFKFVGEKTRLAPEILVKIEKCHHFDQISKSKICVMWCHHECRTTSTYTCQVNCQLVIWLGWNSEISFLCQLEIWKWPKC